MNAQMTMKTKTRRKFWKHQPSIRLETTGFGRMNEAAGGTERRFLWNTPHMYAGHGLGVEVARYDVRKMAGRKDDLPNADALQLSDKPFDEGASGHGDHRLGNIRCEMADARAESAGQDDCGRVVERAGHGQTFE